MGNAETIIGESASREQVFSLDVKACLAAIGAMIESKKAEWILKKTAPDLHEKLSTTSAMTWTVFHGGKNGNLTKAYIMEKTKTLLTEVLIAWFDKPTIISFDDILQYGSAKTCEFGGKSVDKKLAPVAEKAWYRSMQVFLSYMIEKKWVFDSTDFNKEWDKRKSIVDVLLGEEGGDEDGDEEPIEEEKPKPETKPTDVPASSSTSTSTATVPPPAATSSSISTTTSKPVAVPPPSSSTTKHITDDQFAAMASLRSLISATEKLQETTVNAAQCLKKCDEEQQAKEAALVKRVQQLITILPIQDEKKAALKADAIARAMLTFKEPKKAWL